MCVNRMVGQNAARHTLSRVAIAGGDGFAALDRGAAAAKRVSQAIDADHCKRAVYCSHANANC